LRAFLGWLRGEKRHCSMAAIPTVEEEGLDARFAQNRTLTAHANDDCL
jgi:hypothetical protein